MNEPVPSSRSSYRFRLVDVFAERPFAGRPVAVFTDARGLNNGQMQAIARELGQPRTAFVFPPEISRAQARVRIFTPMTELVRAGHMSLATVFALDAEEKLELEQSRRVVLQESEGAISVSFQARVITIKQGLPKFGAVYREPGAVAAALGLTTRDLRQAPLQAVTSGISFLMVPVKDPLRVAAIQFRTDIWERTIRHFPAPHIAAYSLTTQGQLVSAKARVFMPALGVPEDPATEGAAAALVSYSLANQLIALPQKSVVEVSQGAELRRPAKIQVFSVHEDGVVTEIRIGGQCELVGEGHVMPPP